MKVRIYKSPDGNGKYLNKTGQFLEKAQKGKIVKDVLKYGKQLVMNFDEADMIKHRSAELAKAIDKFNKTERAAGAIKYGEGIKKATTASSKIHVKNPSYYQQLLDNTNNLSPSTRQFHNDVLKSVNDSKGMVSQKQYNILKNIENGTFNKYQFGGTPENNQQFQGSNSSQKEASLILASVYNAIKKGQSPEDVYDALIARKMDSKQATQIVTSVVDYMIENDEYTDEDAENNKKAREEEEQKYEDPNQAIEQQKDEEAENQMNQYNEQSLEVANDTSAIEQEEEDAANSSQDYLGFQYGGALGQAVKNQEQEDENEEDLTDEEEVIDEDQNYIKEENENFTSELEKLIANSPGTQNIDYSNIGEYAIPYQPIIETGDYFENNNYENNDLNFTEEYAKYGGSSKKRFSKNVFNLLKKEEGGVQNNLEDTEKEPFIRAKQTDNLEDSVKKTLTDFVGAIGMTSKKFKMDEWFKKMKEVNDPMLEQILNPQSQNSPIQDQNQQASQMLGTQNSTSPALENQQDTIAYGGESTYPQFKPGGRFRKAVEKYFPGNILNSSNPSRNVITKVYNPRTGQMVDLPTGDAKFDRVEVTKRNWLHKPKKYTVFYNNKNAPTHLNPDSKYTPNATEIVDSKNSSLNNKNKKNNVDGLSFQARMAIRKGERQNERNSRRLERRGLDEYGNLIEGNNQGEILDENGRLTRDNKGNWYDRNDNIIPGKKSPSEVPGYYDYLYKDINVLNGDYNNDGYVDALDFVNSSGQMNLKNSNLNKSQDPELWKDKKVLDEIIIKPILKQYGGAINKFLPKKTIGGPPPCGAGETLDPTTNKCVASPVNNNQTFNTPDDSIFSVNTQSNSSSNVLGPPVIGAPVNDFWANQDSFNKPNNVNVDPKYDPSLDPDVMPKLPIKSVKDYFQPKIPIPNANDQIAVDVENKNNKGKLTFGKNNTGVSEARLSLFNTGVDMLDSASRNIDYQKSAAEMQENTSSNNQYANKTTMDFGDYDPNSGLFRPNEMGSKRDGRSAQYGGYIDEEEYDLYADEDEEDELTYAKGGEKITYMSEDQIRAFMAAGGQVEFL
jgi:hypothetical protein